MQSAVNYCSQKQNQLPCMAIGALYVMACIRLLKPFACIPCAECRAECHTQCHTHITKMGFCDLSGTRALPIA